MENYDILIKDKKQENLFFPENKIDLNRYIGRGEKMFFTDAQEYINNLRDCDRV